MNPVYNLWKCKPRLLRLSSDDRPGFADSCLTKTTTKDKEGENTHLVNASDVMQMFSLQAQFQGRSSQFGGKVVETASTPDHVAASNQHITVALSASFAHNPHI